jgi:hypothetical protein
VVGRWPRKADTSRGDNAEPSNPHRCCQR